MCSECVKDTDKKEIFFKKNQFVCESCDLWQIYISVLVLVILGYICLIIFTIHRESQEANAAPSIGKILSTHLEFVQKLSLQGFSLPSSVEDLKGYLSIIISTEGLFNILSCMSLYVSLSLYLLRLLITLFSIAVFIMGLFLSWSLIAYWKKISVKEFKKKFVTSIVVLTYYLHSSYVNFFLTNLSCREYEKNNYLANALGQECWDDEHMLFSSVITIPMVVAWMIVLPGFVYRLTRLHHKKKMEGFEHVVRYFVVGFKEKYYYWEFAILLKKYIFILMPLVLKNQTSIPIQVLYAFIMLIYLIIHTEVQPYSLKIINKLQFLSYYACLISYFIPIITFLTENKILLILISILYLVFNLAFYLFWIYIYYELIVKRKWKGLKNVFSRIIKRNKK